MVLRPEAGSAPPTSEDAPRRGEPGASVHEGSWVGYIKPSTVSNGNASSTDVRRRCFVAHTSQPAFLPRQFVWAGSRCRGTCLWISRYAMRSTTLDRAGGSPLPVDQGFTNLETSSRSGSIDSSARSANQMVRRHEVLALQMIRGGQQCVGRRQGAIARKDSSFSPASDLTTSPKVGVCPEIQPSTRTLWRVAVYIIEHGTSSYPTIRDARATGVRYRDSVEHGPSKMSRAGGYRSRRCRPAAGRSLRNASFTYRRTVARRGHSCPGSRRCPGSSKLVTPAPALQYHGQWQVPTELAHERVFRRALAQPGYVVQKIRLAD